MDKKEFSVLIKSYFSKLMEKLGGKESDKGKVFLSHQKALAEWVKTELLPNFGDFNLYVASLH